ncbi:MAG: ABC transporter permease [Candidatus Thermoplasmatota archaeon]|nr:ABC transporter permease [Candidatus Thermoplasmatota archaeon]
MEQDSRPHRKLPSDLKQIPIVWSYEILKYFRSWRLVASFAIVVAMLVLLYALPPALGSPYAGTDTERVLWVRDFGDMNITVPGLPIPQSYAAINRSLVDEDSLVIRVDGSPYPSANGMNWIYTKLSFADDLPSFMGGSSRLNVVIFMQNLTASTVTATYDWSTTAESFDSLFLAFASTLVIIAATFFGSDAIVGEFQNRTGYLVLPTPLKKWVLFAGKFAASMTVGLLVTVAFYAGVTLLSFVTVGGVDDDFGLSFLFAVEFLLAATAVAYLISSVLKGSTGATVLTFLLFIIILPIVDSVSIFSGVKIDASLTFASGAIGYIVYDPYPVDTSLEHFGFTIYTFYPEPWVAAVVCFAYAVVAIALSLILFYKKQLMA